MTLSNHDQVRIREYLLGKLTADEQEKIEERLMIEDDLFKELEISTGERIEEYRAGTLSQPEREWFERFLAAPEGRRDHAFAVAIECLERSQRPRPLSLRERFELFFRKPQWAIATVALTALVISVSVFWIRSPQQSKFIAVTLTNTSARRAAAEPPPPKVQVPSDTDELRVTLTLPQPATTDTQYQVELDSRPTTTTFEPSGHDANSVSVVIPIKSIPPGFYALRIFEVKKDGTRQRIPGDYKFIRT